MMKYLFFDLEYASQKGGTSKICEFGYVVTDENFNILEKDNLIINPNIYRYEWDYRVLRKILTRRMKEYEESLTFDKYYEKILFCTINSCSRCNAGYSSIWQRVIRRVSQEHKTRI